MVQLWMSEFLQTSREYITYLQHLSILLASASAFIIYKSEKKEFCSFIFPVLAFIMSVVALILGLNAYGELLGIAQDLRYKPEINLTRIKPWIVWQFYLDVAALIILSIWIFCAKYKRCTIKA